jgi:hypothetical protein
MSAPTARLRTPTSAPTGEVFERGARLRLLPGLLVDSELGEKAFPKPIARL